MDLVYMDSYSSYSCIVFWTDQMRNDQSLMNLKSIPFILRYKISSHAKTGKSFDLHFHYIHLEF